MWGGMHGALSLALALSLDPSFPYRSQILTMTFVAVAFTIIVEGLTINPLLRILGVSSSKDDIYGRAPVREIAVAAAQGEVDSLFCNHLISSPVYERYRHELETRLEKAKSDVNEIYHEDEMGLLRKFIWPKCGRLLPKGVPSK